jgi:hypothetical protein
MTDDVVVQPRAERDIQIAAHWNLGQSASVATALRWVRNFRAKRATLKTSPQRCPIDTDSEVYGEEVRVLLLWQAARRIPGAVHHPRRYGPRADGPALGAAQPGRGMA